MSRNSMKCTSSSSPGMIQNLQLMCRTCLKPRTTNTSADMKFFSMFDTHKESRELIGSLLIDCTDIDLLLEKNRLISTSICRDCYEKLLRWYHFRELAKASNIFFMESLSTNKAMSKNPGKKRKRVRNDSTIGPQVIDLVESAEEVTSFKSEPTVKIKIVTPKAVSSVEENSPEPCIPVVKIQKVSKDTPTFQIKKVETLTKATTKPIDVTPQVKIQKIEVDVVTTPLYVSPQVKIQELEVDAKRNEPVKNEIVTLASDEDDIEVFDNFDNGEETLEIDGDVGHQSDTSDDFNWPESKNPQNEAEVLPKPWVKSKTYYCCQCPKNFSAAPEIREHIRTDHAEYVAKMKEKEEKRLVDYPFQCEYCTVKYPSYKALMKHQEYYGEAAKLCTICGEVVPNYKLAFGQHLKTHQVTSETDKVCDVEIRCCMCAATFMDRSDLIAHAEAVHTEKINKCINKSNFSSDPWECDICTSKFATQGMMRRHQMRYKYAEICPDCGILVPSFRRISHANMHMGSALNRHLCEICMKRFRSVAAIRSHMELHSSEIQLNCTYPDCTAVLRTNAKLLLHLQDHRYRDLGKTIPCPEPGCTMMFYAHKPSHLTRHKRIHTGKTYFDCTICSKSFVDSTDFKRHQWQHSGVSPYMCKYCNKMHMRKKQLLEHEAVCLQSASFDNSYCLANNRQRRRKRL